MSNKVEPFERIVDLLLVLINATRPLTLREIVSSVPGYPSYDTNLSAARKAFDRDKNLLARAKIFVNTVEIEGPEQYGYEIDKSRCFLTDLELTSDEQIALALAWQLVADASVQAQAITPVMFQDEINTQISRDIQLDLFIPSVLEELNTVIRKKQSASFDYEGKNLIMKPERIRFTRTGWYVDGKNQLGQQRTLRLEKIKSIHPISSRDVDSQDSSDGQISDDSKHLIAKILVDHTYSTLLERDKNKFKSFNKQSDGTAIIEVYVDFLDRFRTWILSLTTHVLVLEPSDIRKKIIDWLEDLQCRL